jgi:uncharacterized protein
MDTPIHDPAPPFPEILRVEVGSTIHGIGLANLDDRDEMGVCIEPPDHVIGLKVFEQYEYRSARERTGVRDAPSQPGDLDLTVYSLRKYLRLALKGNPTVLLLLFVPEDRLVVKTPLGKELQELAPAIASRAAGQQFLGYLTAQKQRLLRERGTAKIPKRDDHNAKYVSHMLRLGYQGVEFLNTGRITLPMPERERRFVLEAKRGEADRNHVLATVAELEREIADLITSSPLQEEPDRGAVNDFLIDAHLRSWNETEKSTDS